MSDYAEPFAVSGGIFVNDSACRQIASLDHGPGSRLYREKLAARIVACVNGCEGINPEAVPELLKGYRNIIDLIGALDCGAWPDERTPQTTEQFIDAVSMLAHTAIRQAVQS